MIDEVHHSGFGDSWRAMALERAARDEEVDFGFGGIAKRGGGTEVGDGIEGCHSLVLVILNIPVLRN